MQGEEAKGTQRRAQGRAFMEGDCYFELSNFLLSNNLHILPGIANIAVRNSFYAKGYGLLLLRQRLRRIKGPIAQMVSSIPTFSREGRWSWKQGSVLTEVLL